MLARVVTCLETRSQACFSMPQVCPEKPGAIVEDMAFRLSHSSSTKNRWKEWGGVIILVQCNIPQVLGKETHCEEGDLGLKVRELLVSQRVAMALDFQPCLHFTTSQTSPWVMTVLAHCCLAWVVVCHRAWQTSTLSLTLASWTACAAASGCPPCMGMSPGSMFVAQSVNHPQEGEGHIQAHIP